MKSPYFLDEPAVVSFSGGRTSAYMLYRIIDAHGGKLPDYIKVCFANTGKEMPQTLDFVQRCSDEWGVDIVWLERFAQKLREQKKNKKYSYTTKVVNYDTASRNGEPFLSLIRARRYMPNPVARFCTVDLKIRAISEYLADACGYKKPYIGCIGIRADEKRRAAKMHGTIESGQERYLPLFLDGVCKEDIGSFWESQPFDLDLPNNKGTTDWGNCDLCFLKGMSKKISLIRDRPDLADWWIEAEAEAAKIVGKGAFFRSDQPSYQQLKIIATDQGQLFDFADDETIPCFCGD